MLARCLDLVAVITAFMAVYCLVPLLAVRALMPVAGVARLLLVSLTVGMALQAVLGLVSGFFFRLTAGAEGFAYYLFWLVAGLVLCFRRRATSNEKRELQSGGWLDVWLMLIVGVGVALRCVHPLLHEGLGQSDAYSHLQYIGDILSWGAMRNPGYPPGYHWVMALPTATFNLDPYLVARYGGAAFGGFTILAFFELARRHMGIAAGVAAACLVAWFPGLLLLAKTTVGSFPSQVGLLLIPIALCHYLDWRTASSTDVRLHLTMFVAATMALATMVPLMLVELMLFLGLERMVAVASREQGCWAGCRRLAVALIPAMLVLGVVFVGIGSSNLDKIGRTLAGRAQKVVTAPATEHKEGNQVNAGKVVERVAEVQTSLAVGGEKAPPSLGSRIWSLAGAAAETFRGFVLPKHVGLGSRWLNGAGLFLMVLFMVVVVRGALRKDPAGVLLGVVGAFASLQTLTGTMEFRGYQRAGWLLLEALAWLGGVLLAWFWNARACQRLARCSIVLSGGLALVYTAISPPGHRLVNSAAEDRLVRTARELAVVARRAAGIKAPMVFESVEPSGIYTNLLHSGRFDIMSRRFSTFTAHQGNPLDAIARIRGVNKVLSVAHAPADWLPSTPLVIVLDNPRALSANDLGAFVRVNANVARTFTKVQKLLSGDNVRIEALMVRLVANGWSCESSSLAVGLKVVVAIPPTPGAELLQ